jgi:hypothetical protein
MLAAFVVAAPPARLSALLEYLFAQRFQRPMMSSNSKSNWSSKPVNYELATWLNARGPSERVVRFLPSFPTRLSLLHFATS